MVATSSCKGIHGLQMASFLGQKDVEQCAVAAVHAAMLFLLKGHLPELAGTSPTFRSHSYEWLQVLYVSDTHFYPDS